MMVMKYPVITATPTALEHTNILRGNERRLRGKSSLGTQSLPHSVQARMAMFAHNPNTMSRLGLDCFQNPKGLPSTWTMVEIDVARTREVEGASSRKMSVHHVCRVS